MSVPTVGNGSVDADTQAAFASTLVNEWERGGVAHAVVCPGSRSTPLLLALAAHPGIAVHVRLDERSAGFTALGIGLATGVPAVVVTTSGTAAAELHAAVVEADLSGVPLIACTADRPPELRGVGAPQTIDQAHLFGGAPRWFCDPGVPAITTRTAWRSIAARAVAEATSGPNGPGPVHLNLPFREPLIGDPIRGGVAPGRADGRPWHQIGSGPISPPADTMTSLIESGTLTPERRGLIVAGSGCGDPSGVLALSATLGWPLLADPRSGLRSLEPMVIGAADGILRSEGFASAHLPETILALGGRWASKVVNGFLSAAAEAGARRIAVDPFGRWPDPERHTSMFIRCDPSRFGSEATSQLKRSQLAAAGTDARPWSREWQEAEARAQRVIAEALVEGGAGSVDGQAHHQLTEPWLARRLLAHLPSESTLVVSSSMPIRDLEAYGAPRTRPPRVLANRGANGIDGVVSTALGVALSSPDPTVALVGDLAFLHDSSALVCADGFNAALTVVVADNAGGGIFSFLDPASAFDSDAFDTLFGTPQAVDVAAVAAGSGWPVDEVVVDGNRTALEAAMDRRQADRRLSVIRVRLPTRADNVAIHDRINAAIVDAVDACSPKVED